MRVIREGKLPDPKAYVYQGVCNRCGCVIECDEEELSKVKRDPHPYRQCPTLDCNYNIPMMLAIKAQMKSGEAV